MPDSINIGGEEIKIKANGILSTLNNSFLARGEFMHIIDEGEASCMALSLLATEKKIENVIVVDERTTRMICENPENLRRLFENKLHTKVSLKQDLSFLN
jgi:predicted nucleic acid-binding protein